VRGRVGTVLIVFVLCGMWGLLWINGSFAILVGGLWFVALLGSISSRDGALNFGYKHSLVWLPVKRREARHNSRAHLLRRKERLRRKADNCTQLIRDSTEEYERLRLPVLGAERDAAEREIQRLEEDIERMENAWKIEDRERDYRKLTA
jgi:hypothetical protein